MNSFAVGFVLCLIAACGIAGPTVHLIKVEDNDFPSSDRQYPANPDLGDVVDPVWMTVTMRPLIKTTVVNPVGKSVPALPNSGVSVGNDLQQFVPYQPQQPQLPQQPRPQVTRPQQPQGVPQVVPQVRTQSQYPQSQYPQSQYPQSQYPQSQYPQVQTQYPASQQPQPYPYKPSFSPTYYNQQPASTGSLGSTGTQQKQYPYPYYQYQTSYPGAYSWYSQGSVPQFYQTAPQPINSAPCLGDSDTVLEYLSGWDN
ncbi:uncharacterized protein LOC129756211 [Uranotaenia lowii]|uniref:uncharacterized protein LOC129756211 n=1 Tax=Uranotaenia lowii TaxID=190385 RepID=UPI0024790C1C|nr:uncharacterized protein LOC129756211 [Uranotaenia lowii]